jgi:hypothetical protein
MNARVNRSRDDLISRLREHRSILSDYHEKACRELKHEYLGEIAGKLRLLTLRSKWNRPLLLDLMAETGSTVPITIDSPRGRFVTDLPAYLERPAGGVKLPSGQLVTLSKSDLIALWSQQSGAAHEDWELDEPLAAVFANGLFVNGQPIHGAVLCAICRTVLHVATEFLRRHDATT